MTPNTVNGLLWLWSLGLFVVWHAIAWRRVHDRPARERAAITTWTGAALVTCGHRAAVWLGWLGGHTLAEWWASAVLALAVAGLTWVFAESMCGRLPPDCRVPEGKERA